MQNLDFGKGCESRKETIRDVKGQGTREGMEG
jgi:hypothetical protein